MDSPVASSASRPIPIAEVVGHYCADHPSGRGSIRSHICHSRIRMCGSVGAPFSPQGSTESALLGSGAAVGDELDHRGMQSSSPCM